MHVREQSPQGTGDAGASELAAAPVGKYTGVQRQAAGASPGAGPEVPNVPGAPEVQRRGDGAGDDAAVHAAAQHGTRGASEPLPHLDTIQRLFGRHDVTGVKAHTGDDAATGARAMGAQAFATGDHVAFAGAPSLHTAAHEAAHVVQQRGGVQLKGGVGEAGDAYERHADQVADAVVQGTSAEGLLDRYAGGAGASPAVQQVAVQRIVRVTPTMYLAGIGATAPTATAAQLDEYLRIVIADDLTLALAWAQNPAPLTADQQLLQDPLQTPQQKIAALPAIIARINAEIGDKRNAETRYATTPALAHGYQHTAGGGSGVTWADDADMRGKVGPALATSIGKQPALGTRDAAGAADGKLAVNQLPWDEAKQMLPRPLINLLFDVRFQLEGGAVIDERSAQEQQSREKSPHDGGALRSWHLDSARVLPGNGFAAAGAAGGNDNVPAHGQALHAHYGQTSQNGAGASIGAGRDRPQGFAEYTGTGSNTEHNTKVVLDYMNKRVYLTLSHYQYWALAKVGGAWRFVEGGSQDKNLAEATIAQRCLQLHATEHQVMSPWLEIVMPSAAELNNPTARVTPPPPPVVAAPVSPVHGSGAASSQPVVQDGGQADGARAAVEQRIVASVGTVTPTTQESAQAEQLATASARSRKRRTGKQAAVTPRLEPAVATQVAQENQGGLSYAAMAGLAIGVLIAVLLYWYLASG